MVMAKYFLPGASPRGVVERDTRRHELHMAEGYSSVDLEMSEAEHAVDVVTTRLDGNRRQTASLAERLTRGIGDPKGPCDDGQRMRWERDHRKRTREIPRDEALLVGARARVEMLQAVLAGRQADDRPIPVPREAPAPPAPEPEYPEPETDSAVHLDWQPTEEESPTAESAESTPDELDPRVAEVVEHLDSLQVPTDLGRARVRHLLAERDPDYRVRDAHLAAAITHRRKSR